MSHPLNRRQFVAASAAALGLVPLLSACGGSHEPTTAAECPGYDTLTPDQLQTRQALGYVDASPYADKRCNNCRFYNRTSGDGACGGCQLFPGPVMSKGHCNSWAALA